MSHFGRSGPPDIRDTYSLLVLNITFRTTADDLFPLFDKYGKVVDIFIPRDRRTGDSRGFAFVRYKYPDEASKAVEKLDGRNVDGRDIMVQFAKYGPNAERISKGRVSEPVAKIRGSRERSRSRSPRRSSRSRDEHRGRDSRRRSRSRSRERYDDRSRGRGRDSRHRSRTRSLSPDYRKGGSRSRYEEERRRSRSKSAGSASPVRRSPSPRKRSASPRRTPPRGESPDRRSHESPRKRSPSPIPRSVSPQREPARSRSPSQQNSDADSVRGVLNELGVTIPRMMISILMLVMNSSNLLSPQPPSCMWLFCSADHDWPVTIQNVIGDLERLDEAANLKVDPANS
ncbi:hypothetical protein MKW98_008936 [Papaver atlanticum]|uniref:RRM domain-containing protein n=1 Tax=Papaver atlanticum TaxID=357466 RepID=A0AAD4SJ45_9MAGN|nr:hypothetical protein MKW98_008936 [Papaver atlanticum]